MQEGIEDVLKSPIYRQMLPNIVKLMSILSCLPESTASVEHSISMKTLKTRLRNRLADSSLSNLIKVVIEGPDKLSDIDLDKIVNLWTMIMTRALQV